ncbi:hypothetical protein R1L62_26545, partial [Klebsiella sp. 99573]|uniref:hypothetical protein n=1 Tax=Klebsiella TaxID=570 RepID=UPI0022400839
QTETEATGAPQKHHYTLNQQVGSITNAFKRFTSIESRVQLVIGGIRVCRLTFAMAHFYHPLR